MNKSFIESDFLAARVKTAETIMNATGWKPCVLNSKNIGIDSVFLYVYDCQTNWTWCCSVPKVDFFELLEKNKNTDNCSRILLCGKIISECAKEKSLMESKQNDLAIAVSLYTGITKAFELTANATKANHFAVIRHGATDRLRPFALGGPAGHLIEAGSIIEAYSKVITMDSINHPDWALN